MYIVTFGYRQGDALLPIYKFELHTDKQKAIDAAYKYAKQHISNTQNKFISTYGKHMVQPGDFPCNGLEKSIIGTYVWGGSVMDDIVYYVHTKPVTVH
jgi:hypothetical protein